MKLHELKIKDEYMDAILFGRKTFELRKNDRDYQAGDLIKFNVVCKDGTIETEKYLSIYLNKELYKIIYVLKDVPQYGLDADYCILGIKRLRIEEV